MNAVATPPAHVRLAPATACTSANRMDIFVDEDGIMYECECQMLVMGTLCAWQVIGGTDPVKSRKLKRHHKRVRLVIAYAKPSVVA